jgi:hypothetical protein
MDIDSIAVRAWEELRRGAAPAAHMRTVCATVAPWGGLLLRRMPRAGLTQEVLTLAGLEGAGESDLENLAAEAAAASAVAEALQLYHAAADCGYVNLRTHRRFEEAELGLAGGLSAYDLGAIYEGHVDLAVPAPRAPHEHAAPALYSLAPGDLHVQTLHCLVRHAAASAAGRVWLDSFSAHPAVADACCLVAAEDESTAHAQLVLPVPGALAKLVELAAIYESLHLLQWLQANAPAEDGVVAAGDAMAALMARESYRWEVVGFLASWAAGSLDVDSVSFEHIPVEETDEPCCVCLEAQRLGRLRCGHIVCLPCIRSWASLNGENSTCPMCRTPLVDKN